MDRMVRTCHRPSIPLPLFICQDGACLGGNVRFGGSPLMWRWDSGRLRKPFRPWTHVPVFLASDGRVSTLRRPICSPARNSGSVDGAPRWPAAKCRRTQPITHRLEAVSWFGLANAGGLSAAFCQAPYQDVAPVSASRGSPGEGPGVRPVASPAVWHGKRRQDLGKSDIVPVHISARAYILLLKPLSFTHRAKED
jgi:hypothetical protein